MEEFKLIFFLIPSVDFQLGILQIKFRMIAKILHTSNNCVVDLLLLVLILLNYCTMTQWYTQFIFIDLQAKQNKINKDLQAKQNKIYKT